MMRRSVLVLTVALVLLGAATSVTAEEIIYFANGTSMPVQSHRVEKDMISVELGAGSRMAFPVSMVDKIEAAGRDVYLNPTYHPANQALPGSGGGSGSSAGPVYYPVSGSGSTPSRFSGASQRRRGVGGSPDADPSRLGAPGGGGVEDSAIGGSPNEALRRLRVVGDRTRMVGPDPNDPAGASSSIKNTLIPTSLTQRGPLGASGAVGIRPRITAPPAGGEASDQATPEPEPEPSAENPPESDEDSPN